MKTPSYDPKTLTRPLGPDEVEWMIVSTKDDRTTLAPYIEARVVMQRLDEAFGPFNWQLRFREFAAAEHRGVLAEIAVRHPETGEWVVKSDGAEPSDNEPFKGALSNALKRAAVQWGIGRELYDYPTITIEGKHKYIPYPVLDRLRKIVEAIASGKKPPRYIRLTRHGDFAQKAA